jgi:hypothetical protein
MANQTLQQAQGAAERRRQASSFEQAPALLRCATYFSFLQGAVLLSHTARTSEYTKTIFRLFT